MITHERVRHSGALILNCMVTDGSMVWLESRTYQGYPVREAKRIHRDYLAHNGLTIVD